MKSAACKAGTLPGYSAKKQALSGGNIPAILIVLKQEKKGFYYLTQVARYEVY
jgi:hypothetical protein